ncbi:MAG: hypothetical protein JSV89_05980 [Spirochaetaceae bacterium]|nr:MAG: hypothetical protein JSV89_05980 [Spirochaetaceae bacterium]
MKRLIFVGVLIAGAAGLLPGQSFTVVIHNAEDATFHYVLDPPELIVFDTASSIFPNVVYDYFAEAPAAGDEFAGFGDLGPDQELRLENLSEGKHLLVGFFVIPGERGFPVRVITLQAGGGMDERTYQIYSQPALIKARAGRGRISAYAPIPPRAPTQPTVTAKSAPGVAVEERIGAAEQVTSPAAAAAAAVTPADRAEERGFFRFQIDNQYEDWEAIPTFLSYAADRNLPSFTREQYGGAFEVLPIDRSRHWRTGGTSLNEIKVVNNLESVYLYVSTHSSISPNTSVFLYFHSERNLRRLGATNRFTLELVPSRAEDPGLVVLWEKDRIPVIVGTLASGNFFLEAKIDKDMLYDLLEARPEVTFFDLTTSFFDRQELAYEEFHIASISLADIPTEKTLY